jgi:uncharacterized membrane protein SpoIIM required for sporulation
MSTSADRDAFVRTREGRWQRLEAIVDKSRLRTAVEWSELAALYREVSADLARAQALGLPDDVRRHLDRLAGMAHNRLYGSQRGAGQSLLHAAFIGFPETVRRLWPFVLAAHLLFYGPFFLGIAGPLLWPGFATAVLSDGQLAQMEAMYADGIGRSAGQDAAMAGFYVWNNVGIAFRCFATGALFGLGTVFYLVYNGLVMGTIEGFLWERGLGWNLTDFTISHTPWELTGIAVAGAAGLRMGWALVVTGGRTRLGSLRRAGPDLYRLILGATVLLLVAAAIEGFWSAGPAPLGVKIGFAGIGTAVILLWLGFVGRGRR